jgi:antitoxin component YwqK of YwqJK toxin-antitoxin module
MVKIEIVTNYYKNGEKKSEGEVNKTTGEKYGLWKYWDEEGRLEKRGVWLDGLLHGKWTWYHENKRKSREGYYKNDEKVGVWTEWDETGEVDMQHEF